VRKLPHDAPSEHCPEISAQEEELADLVLRVMDYSAGFNFNLGKAILAKMQYNKNRPYKHGGKKF
jgi:NTP pyrophosphatase (non-canonical NTP hydrolase)